MLTFFKEEKNIGHKQDQGAIYNQVGMFYWETKIGLFSVHMLHIEWQLVMSLHVCICVHLRTSSWTCVCTLKYYRIYSSKLQKLLIFTVL